MMEEQQMRLKQENMRLKLELQQRGGSIKKKAKTRKQSEASELAFQVSGAAIQSE